MARLVLSLVVVHLFGPIEMPDITGFQRLTINVSSRKRYSPFRQGDDLDIEDVRSLNFPRRRRLRLGLRQHLSLRRWN